MLKINAHRMNLDLTVTGYIRLGKIACTRCGCEHLTEDEHKPDALYGAEGKGQVCDTCGTPLAVPQVAVAA